MINQLRVCCAAFRESGGYTHHEDNPSIVYHIADNTLYNTTNETSLTCTVTDVDIQMADEIYEFLEKYRTMESLAFASDAHELTYQQSYLLSIYKIMESGKTTRQGLRKIAKLPDFFVKYKSTKTIKKKAKFVNEEALGPYGAILNDVECEIIHTVKTKNYDGYNITGIIDYKLVSWYNPFDLSCGVYHLTSARIKEVSYCHYADKNATRLMNVKGYKIRDENKNS